MTRLARRSVSTLLSLALAAAACFLLLGAGPSAPPRVPYPEGYREWTHVKSMAILSEEHPLHEQFGGIHHVYANRKAMDALVGGRAFVPGAVLVFDLLEAQEADGAVKEGPRKFIGVMHKDDKAYAATGGWGFEGFARDSKEKRIVTDPVAQCFACHAKQEAHAHVFSRWRR